MRIRVPEPFWRLTYRSHPGAGSPDHGRPGGAGGRHEPLGPVCALHQADAAVGEILPDKGGVEGEPLAAVVKKRRPHLRRQLGQIFGQGGLGQVEQLGRLGDILRLRDGGEIPKLCDMQAASFQSQYCRQRCGDLTVLIISSERILHAAQPISRRCRGNFGIFSIIIAPPIPKSNNKFCPSSLHCGPGPL